MNNFIGSKSLFVAAARPSCPPSRAGGRRLGRSLLLAVPLTAVAACLGLWCGRSCSPDRPLARDMLWEWQRDEALVRQLGLANRCTAAKQAVTAEVVAGRLSLAEAAYRFAEAGEGVDGGTWLGRCPRASSELDASLNVLSWVAFDTENYPGSPEAFSRLLAEYRRQFGEPPAAVSRNWGKALEGCRWQPGP